MANSRKHWKTAAALCSLFQNWHCCTIYLTFNCPVCCKPVLVFRDLGQNCNLSHSSLGIHVGVPSGTRALACSRKSRIGIASARWVTACSMPSVINGSSNIFLDECCSFFPKHVELRYIGRRSCFMKIEYCLRIFRFHAHNFHYLLVNFSFTAVISWWYVTSQTMVEVMQDCRLHIGWYKIELREHLSTHRSCVKYRKSWLNFFNDLLTSVHDGF